MCNDSCPGNEYQVWVSKSESIIKANQSVFPKVITWCGLLSHHGKHWCLKKNYSLHVCFNKSSSWSFYSTAKCFWSIWPSSSRDRNSPLTLLLGAGWPRLWRPWSWLQISSMEDTLTGKNTHGQRGRAAQAARTTSLTERSAVLTRSENVQPKWTIHGPFEDTVCDVVSFRLSLSLHVGFCSCASFLCFLVACNDTSLDHLAPPTG